MGITEALAAVRRVGVIRIEKGRLLIEVDRRHLGALEAHLAVLRLNKALALATLEAEATSPTQGAIDEASSWLNACGVGIQILGDHVCALLPAGADVPAARRALVTLGMGDAVLWQAG